MFRDQRFWLLVSLKLSDEATQNEIDELEARLEDDIDFYERLVTLQNYWNSTFKMSYDQKEKAFRVHLQRLDKL